MKTAKPILSPEQKRARNQYQMAIVPIGFTTFLGFILTEVLVLIILSRLNIVIGSSGSRIFLPFMFGAFLLAHILALRRVRLAGLSLESTKVEVVTRTANNFLGQPAEWWYPQTFLASLGRASVPLFMSGCGWFLWHWPFSPLSALEKGAGMLCFWLFLWAGIVGLIFLRSPHIRIDEDGIVAFPSPFWRRRAQWANVARCEICTIYNFMGQGPFRSFGFQSATGKVLLRLNTNSLSGLSLEEQAEIEREIKRRLRGASEEAVE